MAIFGPKQAKKGQKWLKMGAHEPKSASKASNWAPGRSKMDSAPQKTVGPPFWAGPPPGPRLCSYMSTRSPPAPGPTLQPCISPRGGGLIKGGA